MGKLLQRGAVIAAALGLVAALASTSASAISVMVGADRDNTLYESQTGAFSNAVGDGFFAGTTAVGSIRRGLIHFDVAGSVPAGATINSVSLRLHMSMTIVGAQPVSLRRVGQDWGEGTSNATFGQGGGGGPATPGDATWIHTFSPSQFWGTPGGDFGLSVSATTNVDQVGFYTWGSTGQMVSDVQFWLDSPATNFGWIVLAPEDTSPTAKKFQSREAIDPASRPVLTVDYTPGGGGGGEVPTVSGWGLILMLLLLTSVASVVFGGRRRLAHAADGSTSDAGFGLSSVPFAPAVYGRSFVLTLALTGVGLVLAAVAGVLDTVDLTGSLLCVPVLAYLLHLWRVPRED